MSDIDTSTNVNDHEEEAGATTPDSQHEAIVGLAEEALDLFHDTAGVPYGRLGTGQLLRLDNKETVLWARREYRARYGRSANPTALRNAIEELISQALFDGDTRPVWLRVGGGDREIEIDLGDASFRALRVTGGGTEIAAPVGHFARKAQVGALPPPAESGDLGELSNFLNVADDDDFKLIVAWLLMALRPSGPYPVLVLQGEQGSAKSTAAKALKFLIDPAKPMIRSMPRSERDLAVAAAGNWALAFDNVSFISDWMSDAICRLSTGSGFGARTHYSNDEETVFEQSRPVILNGIDAIARRQDLLDRALVVNFPTIDPEARIAEERFWSTLEEARPRILRALLDVVAAAQARLPKVRVKHLPRLADFARWIAAAEPALGWKPGAFVEVLEARQATALRDSLAGSPVAGALDMFLRMKGGSWEGAPQSLFAELSLHANDASRRRSWPANAQSMSATVSRLVPALRLAGIEVERSHQGRGKNKVRWITLSRVAAGDDGDAGDA